MNIFLRFSFGFCDFDGR